MNQYRTSGKTLTDIFDTISVFAGIILITALSIEIINGEHIHFSQWYMTLQLGVCLVFITTLAIRLIDKALHGRYSMLDIVYLFISIPYLNILGWANVTLSVDSAHIVGFIPILRSFLAMILIVGWLVNGRGDRIFVAYMITVVVFTYIAALIFYDYESGVNSKLNGFGDALWWAWMNVTTVGAAIFPVTAIGKAVCVALPSVGMMFFPVFTVYISQYYTSGNSKRE